MLIVGGTITIEPNQVDQLRPAVAAMVKATLSEPGCHEYSFSENLLEPGVIQVYEIWQTPEALEAHINTEHMATYKAAIADLNITSRELYRYEVANQARL